MLNRIYNEDCFTTMKNMPIGQCDVILTSPFYNTNKKAGKNRNLTNAGMNDGRYEYLRYDVHVDNMTNDENIYNFDYVRSLLKCLSELRAASK